MADTEERAALNGLEKKLFKLMCKGATKAQWTEWLRAPLEHALAKGDKSLALALLAAGADGSAGWKGCGGRTLLGAAAEGGSHEAVSAVLEAGGLEELDTVSGDKGMVALHHAIAGGHTDAARVLMVAGANVGLLDGRGRGALHYAVGGGHLQLVEYVVIGGADPNAGDGDGDTPLHLAAAHDDQALVSTLLRRRASVSATNRKGQHPLHVAVEHERIAVAEALLKAGADPNVFNVFYDYGESPLSLAGRNLAITRSLLEHGADGKLVDEGGYTALHNVGQDGDADVIEALVEAGVDVEAKSGSFCSIFGGFYTELAPLHVAALNCYPVGISTLLRQGADVNAKSGEGQTPLHLVCRRRDEICDEDTMAAIADLLLRGGADETLTDNDGHTPEQLVKRDWVARPLQEVLANAPADRAWRRRGMLVMCRAFPDKISTKGGKGRTGKAYARRGRGCRGGSADGGRGRGNVLESVVELEDDAIFRTIVGFL